MNNGTTVLTRLRGERDRLEDAISDARATIADIRRQIATLRPIVPPSISLGAAPLSSLQLQRALLRTAQTQLTRLEARRDRVERQLEIAKDAQ